jgi:hypothetical protein
MVKLEIHVILFAHTFIIMPGRTIIIINPRCACAERVTVVVLCVCVCVSLLPSKLPHTWFIC